MTRRLLAALMFAPCALWAGSARAADGWRLEVEAQDGGRVQRLSVLLDGEHLRAGEPGAAEEILLTQSDVTLLDHGQKSYTRLTFDVIERMLGGMMEMVRGMKESQIDALKEALDDLSEEDAAAVREQIARLEATSGAEDAEDRYSLEDAGETGTVAGLSAKKYAVLRNGRPAGEAWFTQEVPVALLRDVFLRFRRILPGEMKQGSPFFDVIDDLYGFPVKLVSSGTGGDLDRLEVVEAVAQETSAGDFLPGAEYEPKSLIDLEKSGGKNGGGW